MNRLNVSECVGFGLVEKVNDSVDEKLFMSFFGEYGLLDKCVEEAFFFKIL